MRFWTALRSATYEPVPVAAQWSLAHYFHICSPFGRL